MVNYYFHLFYISETAAKVGSFIEKYWINEKLSLVLYVDKF